MPFALGGTNIILEDACLSQGDGHVCKIFTEIGQGMRIKIL